jgi:hypothetical protein
MSQEQRSTFSGSLYDTYTTTSQWYKENRMPRVGQKVEFEDGRKFVFAKAAESLVAGEVAGNAQVAEMVVDGDVSAGGFTVTVDAQTGKTANQYAGGYLAITNASTGKGEQYRIKSNTATYDTNHVDFVLYDPLVSGVADDDVINVAPARYDGVVEGAAAEPAVGVAVVAIAANAFGWLQYQGPACVLVTTGSGVEDGVAVQAGATGGIVVADGTTGFTIGQATNATAVGDGEFTTVVLTIQG